MRKISILGTHFCDEDGREVLLHGINFMCKEKKMGYFWPDHKRLFAAFHAKGFNLIRFGIFWDAVEPEPGKIDYAYLEKVRQVIRDAAESGLYVIVDMHQDLWSVRYMDGAPEWATITDGAEHPTDCTMWYDAYLRSQAIINAADHFWNNDPAEDGTGLMDHYAAMWTEIADVLKAEENIIAFEPMNEPFMGSIARNSFGLAAYQTSAKYPEFDFQTMTGLTPEALTMFSAIISEQFMAFDREKLMPFYAKMDEAIRKSSEIALATGGNIYCSSDFKTGITRVQRENGILESRQIYCPHGYDTVVDSDNYDRFSPENVARLFSGKRESQKELRMPCIVGEWGAFPSRDFTNTLIGQMNEILEKYLWSSTYWWYLPGLETDPNYSALCRGIPFAVDGELLGYHYDPAGGTLTLRMDGKEAICFIPGKELHVTECPMPENDAGEKNPEENTAENSTIKNRQGENLPAEILEITEEGIYFRVCPKNHRTQLVCTAQKK